MALGLSVIFGVVRVVNFAHGEFTVAAMYAAFLLFTLFGIDPLVAMVPIAVVDRLGPSLYASASAAGQALARARIPEAAAKSLPDRKPPAWTYLHGLKSPLSSTALRAARHKIDAKVPQYVDRGTATG